MIRAGNHVSELGIELVIGVSYMINNNTDDLKIKCFPDIYNDIILMEINNQ